MQDDLPRIRYANPRMNIAVDKKYKTKEEMWKPELVVELSTYDESCVYVSAHRSLYSS